MSEFWEPWQPSKGDRVMIRVSRECPFHALTAEHGTPVEAVQWATGTVTQVNEAGPPQAHGHKTRVRFDEEIPEGNAKYWCGGLFAVVELTPLGTTDDQPAPPTARAEAEGG